MSPTEIIASLSQPLEPIPTGFEPQLKTLKDIQAVVFDVYGTLFISAAGDISLAEENTQKDVMQAAFEAEGLQTDIDSQRLYDLFFDHLRSHRDIRKEDGIAYPEIDICKVWQDFTDELQAYEMISGELSPEIIQRLAIQYECRANPVWPMPNLQSTFESLLDKGQLLALISNAQFYTPLLFKTLLEGSMEDLGISEECCVWSFKEGYGKPSIDLYETALNKLDEEANIEPHEILYVGNDMLNDMLPASKVGMKTALFAGDKRSLRMRDNVAECKTVQPDIVITELSQITECIED